MPGTSTLTLINHAQSLTLDVSTNLSTDAYEMLTWTVEAESTAKVLSVNRGSSKDQPSA